MTSIAEPAASHRSEHKRRVNDLIYDSLRGELDSEPVAFFCECSAARCFESVCLSGGDYREGRLETEWSVLAPGHRVLAPGHRYAGRSHPSASGGKRAVWR